MCLCVRRAVDAPLHIGQRFWFAVRCGSCRATAPCASHRVGGAVILSGATFVCRRVASEQ